MRRPSRSRKLACSLVQTLDLLLFLAATLACQSPALHGLRLDISKEVADTMLFDADGDGLNDLCVLDAKGGLAWFQQLAGGKAFKFKGRQELPAGTAALAVADLQKGGGSELILLDARGAMAMALGPKGPKPPVRLVKLELVFPPDFRGVPRWWSWGQDLDGDGRDDLLLPGLDGDQVYLGSKQRCIPLPLPSKLERMTHPDGLLGVRLTRPRLAFQKVLKGQHLSPLFLGPGGVRVLQGNLKSGYSPTSQLLFPLRTDTAADPAALLQRLDLSFGHLNPDPLEDLIVARTKLAAGARVLEQRTQLLFFRNQGRPAQTPDQVIVLAGVLSNGPFLKDLDGDGREDLLLSVFGGNLSSHLARLLLRRVKLSFQIYRGRQGKRPFPRSPDLTFTDRIPLKDFDTWDRRHRLFFGQDWTGDGRSDLVRVRTDGRGNLTVEVHPGRRPFGFQKKASASLHVRDTFALGFQARELSPGRPTLLLLGRGQALFVTP